MFVSKENFVIIQTILISYIEMENAMDPVHFSGKEILEMVVRIEENGLDFYNNAAKSVKSDSVKEAFTFLASEEVKHVEFFSGLKEAIGEEDSYSIFDPYLEEESMYIRALADTNIFVEADRGREMAEKMKSDSEAIDWAIGFEKDSVLFYNELLSMVREKDRPLIHSIITEEKKHIAKLTSIKG